MKSKSSCRELFNFRWWRLRRPIWRVRTLRQRLGIRMFPVVWEMWEVRAGTTQLSKLCTTCPLSEEEFYHPNWRPLRSAPSLMQLGKRLHYWRAQRNQWLRRENMYRCSNLTCRQALLSKTCPNLFTKCLTSAKLPWSRKVLRMPKTQSKIFSTALWKKLAKLLIKR